MLVSPQSLLIAAQKGRYAVPAFNIENMEMAQAVMAAAEEMQSPIIIQTTPSSVRYANLRLFHGMVAALANRSPIPVALHLDHGESFDMCAEAVREGYTSIMIDGSHLGFEENIALTRRVVEAAGGVAVEAELGKIGGKEDELECEGGNITDPQLAREFVERTGCFSLAVAIGTAHGLYKDAPRLDIGRLTEIRKLVDAPLVLHGCSGLADADVRHCIREGICKINFATELRIAYSDGVKQALLENPGAFDPKFYGKAGRENVKRLAMEKIVVSGSEGHVVAFAQGGEDAPLRIFAPQK